MLEQLHVKGFKSLPDERLKVPRLLVVFGPNAAGKSNLLDSLFVLSRFITERTLADALSPPVRGYPVEAFSLPKGGLSALLKEETARFSLEAVIRPSQKYPTNAHCYPLRYRVGVEIRPRTGDLVVYDEYLSRLRKDGTELGNEHARIETASDLVLVRRRGEPSGRPLHEQLRPNHTRLSDKRYSGKQYPDFEFLRDELGHWRTYYLDPRTAMRRPSPPREVDDIGPTGEQLAQFLYRLKNHEQHSRRFHAVVRAVRSVIPSVDKVEVELDDQRGVVDVLITQYGVPFSIRVVSEGTLRVLALACIALNPWPGALVAFEEPENGVHPRRLEIIADLFEAIAENGERQVVITTHSPRLAAIMQRKSQEHDWIDLAVCRNRAGLTSFTPFSDFGPLFEDAEIKEALTSHSEDGLFNEMLLRGWFDG